jgi:hypothetical protein
MLLGCLSLKDANGETMLNRKLHGVALLSLMVLIVSLEFSGVNAASAQGSQAPALMWERGYGGGGNEADGVEGLTQTSDGGYAFIATNSPYSGAGVTPSETLSKTDFNGTLQWQRQFNITGDYSCVSSLVQTSDGGYVFAGSAGATVLIRVDSSGNMLWNKTYPFSTFDSVMVQTIDGGFAIGGTTGVTLSSSVWLVKTNAYGNVQWQKTYTSNIDRVTDIMQTKEGDYAIVGPTFSASNAGGRDLVLLKTDSSGNLLLNKTYDQGISTWQKQTIIQTTDGGYVLTDNTNSSNKHLVFKTDQNGNITWSCTYATNDTTTSAINSVIETNDDGLAFTGWLQNPQGGFAYIWLIKADAQGNIQWNQTYGNTGPTVPVAYFTNYWGGSRIIEANDGSLVTAGVASTGAYYTSLFMVKTQSFLPQPSPTPIPSLTPKPTPSPTSSTSPTLSPTASPSPSPSIPEFPAWIILWITLISLASVLLLKHRQNDS